MILFHFLLRQREPFTELKHKRELVLELKLMVTAVVGDIQAPPRIPREPTGPGREQPLPPRDPHFPDHGPNRPEPRPNPRPEPRPMPHPVCHDEPIYRTVPYTCYETINVPYEVVDHQTVSNFNVVMTNAQDLNVNAQCAVNFTVAGDNLSTGTNCNEYLVVSSNSQNVSIDRTGTRVQNFNFSLNLFDRNKILAPLAGGLTNLHMDGQNLVVSTGDLTNAKNVTLKLFVQRRRFLKNDETLIDRVLAPSEYTYSSAGGSTGITSIDLGKILGGINTSKKHVIKLQLDVAIPAGNIMNSNIPSTHQESEITVWDN